MTSPLQRCLAPSVVAASLMLVTACSTGAVGESDAANAGPSVDASAFPVTIEHAFGETTIEKPPTRVATISWVNADIALALDVVPVGMATDEWGGNDQKSTPWKDAALERLGAPIGSDRAPAQFSEADGVNFAALAELDPDVILAAYSGITKQDYDKLSKIAPVVAYPEVAWGTPWQDATLLIGKALGRSTQAEQVVDDTEKLISEAADGHPELSGKTFLSTSFDAIGQSVIYVNTPVDNRARFFTELGLEPAPVMTKHSAKDSFYFEWSTERADELDSDVLVSWLPAGYTEQKLAADPLVGQIPAVKRGSFVAYTDETQALAISAASPLSIPWALDEFLPSLSAAAKKA
jgi:iron complex transport system substrate-binding protein